MSFFKALRAAHPYRIGDIINGKRVVATWWQTEAYSSDMCGNPWVRFDDGEDMNVRDEETERALEPIRERAKKMGLI